MLDWKSCAEHFPLLCSALGKAKLHDRLAHAYLVVSSKSDYRLEFPALLAALRVCTSPEKDGSPCMECEVCKQVLNGLYPDYHVLAPTSKAREIVIGKDASEVDTLRHFEAQFHLSSVSLSGWKLGISQDADTMNESAQNAFLKTLEEPPGKCLFILTTARANALLPTIRSRCQRLALTDNSCQYNFPAWEKVPVILEELTLQEHRSLMRAEDCTLALLDISGDLMTGARNDAQERWNARLEAAKELENAGVKLIEKRIEGETGSLYRRSREQFMSLIHTFYAQLLLYCEGTDPSLIPNPELLPDPEKIKAHVNADRAQRMLQSAESLLGAMSTNVNDELALRTFCLSINLLLPKKV